ncbi:Cathepsin K [Folsomia candida]|uniref:Cathepsin K n=1 Tax=Folsomia candida TaxID=158441 RepID=A0A226D4A1_FOLCA|nr:Cathepsin K [Folsomia candida]
MDHPLGVTSSNGCSGGYPHEALEYIQKNGAESWADYSYTGVAQSCTYNASKVVARIGRIGDILGNENKMRAQIGRNGPRNLKAQKSSFMSKKYLDPLDTLERCSRGHMPHPQWDDEDITTEYRKFKNHTPSGRGRWRLLDFNEPTSCDISFFSAR